MTFTEDNFFKIYYVNIKTFPLLEALPWANWSWLLFLNILYPTKISSDTAGKGNSCKAHDSERLRMTSGHQLSLSLLQRMASGLCCCLLLFGWFVLMFLVLEKDSVRVLLFREGADQTLSVLFPFTLLLFSVSSCVHCSSKYDRRGLKLRRESTYFKNENITIHSWLSNVVNIKKKPKTKA